MRTIVAIYLVSQPGVAVGVEAHHAVEIDRGSVWVDDAAPGDLHAVLAVGNVRIVFSDQARALRDQEVEASGRVVDVRGHQRLQLAGKVRVEGLFENRWDLPACFDFVAGQRGFARRAKVVVRLGGCALRRGILPCGTACSGCRSRFRAACPFGDRDGITALPRAQSTAQGFDLRKVIRRARCARELPTTTKWRNCGCWWAPGLLPALAGTRRQAGALRASPRGLASA